MIENYLNGTIWKYFMKNKYVQDGLKILEFSESDKEYCNKNITNTI